MLRNEPILPPSSVPDYHIHTSRCGHATGKAAEYVEAAKAAGLVEIGFSEHLPMPQRDDRSLTMASDDLPLYVDEVLSLRDKHHEISIKLGIEADYFPGHEEWLAQTLNSYPFDYVLGSVHFIGDWGFDDSRNLAQWRRQDPTVVYDAYYQLVAEAVSSGLFDVLAHPDLVKKFGLKPTKDQTANYKMIAQALVRSATAVEISSAGLRKPVGEIYPSAPFLRELTAAGAKFTLGSDAHRPREVGSAFPDLLQLLAECGGGVLVGFTGRRAEDLKRISESD